MHLDDYVWYRTLDVNSPEKKAYLKAYGKAFAEGKDQRQRHLEGKAAAEKEGKP